MAKIKDALEPGIDIDAIQFKVFPDERDSSRGRISIAGTLVTTEERVDIASNPFGRLQEMVLERGITQDQYVRYGRRSGFLEYRSLGKKETRQATLYDVIQTAGQKIDFTSDQLYIHKVNGFEMSGKVRQV